jgi:heme exporter protein A
MIHGLVIEELALSRGVRRLFQGLSLRLDAGEAVLLAGSNGVGKTSLLRAVAGLLRPDAGRVTFVDARGAEIEAEQARAIDLHLAGHHDGLKTQRRAGEEFAFWADWLGGAAKDRAQAIETFDLRPLLCLDVRVLSAGQRRRLALSRLCAAPRSLWLLDEPLAPLDARWREVMRLEMEAHLARGGIILAAAHDPLPIAARRIALAGEAP